LNPVTHGNTFEEAVRNGLIVLEVLIALTQKHGQPLPAPQLLDTAA
jgi:predicted RNase H-like HicB family nuclease